MHFQFDIYCFPHNIISDLEMLFQNLLHNCYIFCIIIISKSNAKNDAFFVLISNISNVLFFITNK